MSFSKNIILTKIHAMHGKMLKSQKYDELINCKNLSEVAKYLLNNSPYSSSIKNLNNEDIKRTHFEDVIKKHAFKNYYKIYRYTKKEKNEIFKLMLEKFEIDEILNAIIFIKSNRASDEDYVFYMPENLVLKCKINLLKLKKIKTIEELVVFLKNTHYNKIISKLKEQEIKNLKYVDFEFLFYSYFFKKLLKTVSSKTKNVELFELKRLIKTKIDKINFCNIYRQKVILNLDKKTIEEKIFPYGKNLNVDLINKMLNCSNEIQFEEILNKNFNKFKNFKHMKIDFFWQQIEQKICENYIFLSSNITTTFYCFFVLQQIEIYNLIHIIEGIYYNMPKEEIKNMLIF